MWSSPSLTRTESWEWLWQYPKGVLFKWKLCYSCYSFLTSLASLCLSGYLGNMSYIISCNMPTFIDYTTQVWNHISSYSHEDEGCFCTGVIKRALAGFTSALSAILMICLCSTLICSKAPLCVITGWIRTARATCWGTWRDVCSCCCWRRRS